MFVPKPIAPKALILTIRIGARICSGETEDAAGSFLGRTLEPVGTMYASYEMRVHETQTAMLWDGEGNKIRYCCKPRRKEAVG